MARTAPSAGARVPSLKSCCEAPATASGHCPAQQLHHALNASKRKQQARINAALDRLDAAGLIERRGGQSIAAEVAMNFDQLMTPDELAEQDAV